MLSASQKEFYRENGYLILENVFTDEDGRRFCHAMLQLVRAQDCPKVKLPDFSRWGRLELVPLLLDSLMELELADHKYIARIYDTIREVPELKLMVMAPKLRAAAQSMLELGEIAPLYLQQTACRIDVPHDKAFTLDWHQEVHYTFKDSQFVQLWCPAVHDIVAANGAMWVQPESHLAGIAPTKDFVPAFGHAQYTVVPEVVAEFEQVQMEMPFGQAVVFNNKLIHKSGVNSTKRPRLTLLAHYHNATMPGFMSSIKGHGAAVNPYKKNS